MRKPAFCKCENKDADRLRGTAWFVWDLIGNPEDRFSHNEAHISLRQDVESNFIQFLVIAFLSSLYAQTSFLN